MSKRIGILCFVAGLFVAFSVDYGFALYMDHADKQAFIRSSCLRQINDNPLLTMSLCQQLMEQAIAKRNHFTEANR